MNERLREKIVYQITKEKCQEMIHGVCSNCGGKLVPIETVDNADHPTFWSGCKRCSIFDNGVAPEIYKIAVKLVDECKYRHYPNSDFTNQEEERYAQIGGASRLISQIIFLLKEEGWVKMNVSEGKLKVHITEKELVEKTGKNVEWFIQNQIDSLTPILRERGWLHKDDPMPDLKGTIEVDVSPELLHDERLKGISKRIKIIESVRVGEALEKVGEMVDLSLYMFDLLKRNRPWKEDDPYYEIWKMVDNALTLKDGRRMERR